MTSEEHPADRKGPVTRPNDGRRSIELLSFRLNGFPPWIRLTVSWPSKRLDCHVPWVYRSRKRATAATSECGWVPDRDVHISGLIKGAGDFLRAHDEQEVFGPVDFRESRLE